MSRHKTGYVISYHGILCHDMSYVTTIAASLVGMLVVLTIPVKKLSKMVGYSASYSFNSWCIGRV